MNYPSIRIEGQIFSGELLQRLEQSDMPGQRPADFGLPSDVKVKDEIARAWAAGQSYYRAFRQKTANGEKRMANGSETSTFSLQPSSLVSETRNLWLIPLLSLLGYNPVFSRRGEELNGKTYPVSHRDDSRDGLPLHLLGWNDSLDQRRKEANGGKEANGEQRMANGAEDSSFNLHPSTFPRMSPHALLQEYLNLTEHLYALVSNGRTLRLLRDSTRLVRQSFIEFDLERMFDEDLFADFAVMFRLLHASRLPISQTDAPASLVEKYHQDALDQGARIRDGLSLAVEHAILSFANGFLAHPDNDALRAEVSSRHLKPDTFYSHLLRLIYRFLFLLVTEERHLIFPPGIPARKRDIYYRHYSLQRIRRLAEKPHLAERRHKDLWSAVLALFRLFEADGPGKKLDVSPLAGDLFSPEAIGLLNQCSLDNGTVLDCLRALSLYQNPDTHQTIRVNYGALNVEEFGSVYQGLLEYDPVFLGGTASSDSAEEPCGAKGLAPSMDGNMRFASRFGGRQSLAAVTEGGFSPSDRLSFAFKQGDERSRTGSHYTPDELVQPLIKHSLDYLIADKLKEKDREKALLSLRVADVSCGSGHILLAAARRIATELAIVRTGEEQPSPTAFRAAVRDVIRECIYGVDLNPLAVELCKVALWLEAHVPGEPLNFLDHHIKCGNAIVGYARREEVERGVPDEAFATLQGDAKETAAELRKRNKAERRDHENQQAKLDLSPAADRQLAGILQRWREIAGLPEKTPGEITAKKKRYEDFTNTADAWMLKQVLAIPIAQFYLPKTAADRPQFITDADFRLYWTGQRRPQGQATAAAFAVACQKRFFHWFLEFPEIIDRGGFDCILGNPPYLGTKHLSGTFGYSFCHYVPWEYAPAGLSDLVAYFVRRIYSLLRPGGFTAFITTNSIKDGDIRRDGLEQVLTKGGVINFVVRGIMWPGRANVVVSLVAVHKGEWRGERILDGVAVPVISAYFEDSEDEGAPKELFENIGRVYQGSIFLGDGFLLTHEEANQMIEADKRNQEVIYSAINGHEVNNSPGQHPDRNIINFLDRSEEEAASYALPFAVVAERVRPARLAQKNEGAKRWWWRYYRYNKDCYATIRLLPRCFVMARVTKYLNVSSFPTSYNFLNTTYVFTSDRWDLYAVVQSTVHEIWARKYSMRLEERLQYSPSDCFETFPLPAGQWQAPNAALAASGERYHEHRRALMLSLWLGLTDIYNLFHAPDLTPEKVAKVSKKPLAEAQAGYEGILELRRLHVQLDTAVRDAYGWQDLDLGHTFVEVETLPENDRTRYTITPAARKELLKRLLALNHQRHAEEVAAGMHEKRTGKTGKKNAAQATPGQRELDL